MFWRLSPSIVPNAPSVVSHSLTLSSQETEPILSTCCKGSRQTIENSKTLSLKWTKCWGTNCKIKCISFSFPEMDQTDWEYSNNYQGRVKACLCEGIKVSWNVGPVPFPRGDNKKKTKIYWRNLKVFFSIIFGSIHNQTSHSTNLGEN